MTLQQASFQLRSALAAIYGEGEAIAITNWVLEHLTAQKKTSWSTENSVSFSAAQETLFERYKTELLSCRPVQYVLHEAWFYGLCLYVDESVLIPRPETEELVDWLVKDIRATGSRGTIRILDIGTGSGCIPLAIKSALPSVEMHSCDISEAALGVAGKNASDHGLKIHFHHLDILDKSSHAQLPPFDIIISNPPYIPESDRSSMHSNVLKFEPFSALFVPDGDPLIFYRAIASFALSHLKPGGKIYLEIDDKASETVPALFREAGYHNITAREDMQQRTRMLRVQAADD